MLRAIDARGSFASAAKALGLVPSALTYRIRQLEDSLDVLLFDRSARKACLTGAGRELLTHGSRIMDDLEAVAHRVKRVATGWESQLTIAVDSLLSQSIVHELCTPFFALSPPTALKLRSETLTGTWESLVYGESDIALGVVVDQSTTPGIKSKPLGEVPFVFAVAPHHPLASMPEPLRDEHIQAHRAVAVADSAKRGTTMTTGLLRGQPVLTVANMQAKLDAHLRGLGCGFLPEPLALSYAARGQLVIKRTERSPRIARVAYAWRDSGKASQGKALAWWLNQLASPKTRQALLGIT